MKRLFCGMITGALVMVASSVMASYPEKPVKIIVPFSPGGTSDFVARLTAQKLSDLSGKQFYVENKPGASGRIGYDAGAKAPADGYTIIAADTSYAMLPGLYPKLAWVPDTDLKSITVTAQTPVVIVVNPITKFKSLKDLITFAKNNPGKLNYGSGGAGSATHLSAELFKSVAGVDIAHIPFKGAGEAATGLLSGTVELLITSPPTVIGHIKKGTVTALAVSSDKRSAALPNVPSIVEAGLPGYALYFWFGLMAPKGTPDGVVDYLQKSVAKILVLPEVKEMLAKQIVDPVGSTPIESANQLNAETKRWREIIKSAGVTLD